MKVKRKIVRWIGFILAVCICLDICLSSTKDVWADVSEYDGYEEEYGISYEDLFLKYPIYLSNVKEQEYISYVIGIYDDVINGYNSGDNWLASFMYSLREGSDIILHEMLHTIGMGDSNSEKFLDSATLLLMKSIINKEDVIKASANKIMSSYSDIMKPSYDITTEAGMASLARAVKDAKVHINDSTIDQVLELAHKDSDKLFGGISDVFEHAKILITIFEMHEIELDVMDILIKNQNYDNDLKSGLLRLQEHMKGGGIGYLLKEETVKYIGKSLDDLIGGALPAYQVGKIFMYVASKWIYQGASADDIIETTYLKNFTASIYSSMTKKNNAFLLKNADLQDIEEFEILYNAYLASIKATLESAKEIAKTTRQRNKINMWLESWDTGFSYKKYITLCMEEVKKDIESGKLVIDGGTPPVVDNTEMIRQKFAKIQEMYPPNQNVRFTSEWNGTIQCFGFASMVFSKLFDKEMPNTYLRNAKYQYGSLNNVFLVGQLVGQNVTASSVKSLMSQGKLGDVIQAHGKRYGQHTMIFVEATDTGIVVYDCNAKLTASEPDCVIHQRTISYAGFADMYSVRTDESEAGVSLYRAIGYGDVVYNGGEVIFDDSVNYVIEEGVLTKYNGYQKNIVIPDGVTEIDYRAFSGNTNIVTVKLPDTVTMIDSYAFENCTNLVDIQFSESLIELGTGAFQGCSNLIGINLPGSLVTIWDSAFEECANLSYVYLSRELKDMKRKAFSNCKKLSNIQIPASLEFCTAGTEGPFYGCDNLTDVTFEEGITIVAGGIFAGCLGIKEIAIPDTVIEIGKHAFYSCSNLYSITLPEYVIEIGDYAFSECTALKQANLPDNIETLGNSVFDGCSNLEQIHLPLNLKYLGGKIISECNKIMSVNIPANIEYVDGYALYGPFAGCKNLKKVTFEQQTKSIPARLFKDCESLESIEIPKGVKEIGKNAFYGCTNLTSVVIPDGVEQIYYAAFEDCIKLEEIVLPSSLVDLEANTFRGCTSLENVKLPDGLLSMGEGVFRQCKALKSIVLPKKLQIMGSSMFYECSSLQTVDIPDFVENIREFTFYKCISLESVNLGKRLESIEEYAFTSCLKLKEVTLPLAMKSVENYAFTMCTSLNKIIIPRSVTSIGTSVFSYKGKMKIYGCTGTYAESYAGSEGINFVPIEFPISSLAFKEDVITAKVNEDIQLELVIEPETTTDTLTWKVDEESKYTITEYGCVRAYFEGSTIVTVTASSGVTAQCTLICGELPEELRLTNTPITLTKDKPIIQLNPEILPENAVSVPLTWKSNNPAVVNVDSQGFVTAVSNGTATITVSAKGTDISAECVVISAVEQQENQEIQINMEDTTTITPELLKTAQSLGGDLVLNMDTYSWKVDSDSVTDQIVDNIELGVEKVNEAVPADIITETLEEHGIGYQEGLVQQIELLHNGNFGFTAWLNMPMDSVFNGKVTNLFYYNEATSCLEFVDNYVTQENGIVSLPFTHASTYVLVGSNQKIEVEGQLGDVNGDGEIDIFDIQLIQRHILEIELLSEKARMFADVNKDGEIDIFDIQKIQRHILEIEMIN